MDVCLFKRLPASDKHKALYTHFSMVGRRTVLGFCIHKGYGIFVHLACSFLYGTDRTGLCYTIDMEKTVRFNII